MQVKGTTRQRGIALIQVLIISIILTMLAIFISQTVRDQVAIAKLSQESYRAKIAVANVEAELLYTLLTNSLYRKNDSENVLVKKWNFHGEPFAYDQDTSISIQDMSSLLSLNSFKKSLALRLFAQLGYQEPDVRHFLDALIDWKDTDSLKQLNGAEAAYYSSEGLIGPRNGLLQSHSEVLDIRQSNILTLDQWQQYFSITARTSFNPINAPEIILSAFLGNEDVFQAVIEQRKKGVLTANVFSQITGVTSDEGIKLFTGQLLTIKIVTNAQNSQFSKSFIVQLKNKSPTRPVTFSNVMWNNE